MFEGAEEEEPGGGAEDGHESGEEKSVVERAGVLDEETGDNGSGDACEIADEVLQAGPAAGSAGSGENLRNDPGVGNVEAVCSGGEQKKRDGEIGVCDGTGGDGESAAGLAPGDHGFADASDAAAARDEAIGSVSAGDADRSHECVGECADSSHAGQRKLPLVNEIVGSHVSRKYRK